MCNVNCLVWGAKHISPEEIRGKRVIEVGSYDVNGSLRSIVNLLQPKEYVGVDVTPGPGVDKVVSACDLAGEFGKDSFDFVVTTCTLEHVRYWKPAISNLKNICRPQGTILFIVPSRCAYHGYPYDFWRYSVKDVENIFSDCKILSLEEDKTAPSLVYAKIIKPVDFSENKLDKYELYSVVTRSKVNEIKDKDLKGAYFSYLKMKHLLAQKILKQGRMIFANI